MVSGFFYGSASVNIACPLPVDCQSIASQEPVKSQSRASQERGDSIAMGLGAGFNPSPGQSLLVAL